MVAYSPLANGLLGGADILKREVAGKQRWGGPGFDAKQRTQALVMDAIASEAGIAPSKLAIAWLLIQQPVASTIIGSERIQSLETSCAAVEVDLMEDVKSKLDGISELG